MKDREEIQEGDLTLMCWGCGVSWWMDFEAEPYDHCPSVLFRLGIVQDDKVEWGNITDDNGDIWTEDWWAGDATNA